MASPKTNHKNKMYTAFFLTRKTIKHLPSHYPKHLIYLLDA